MEHDHNKAVRLAGNGDNTSIKFDHPGPTGKRCTGMEVRMNKFFRGMYEQGYPVNVFCPGCGYIDTTQRKRG